jgi:diadenosine tetraphosphatase ApaH/serine/threonine PP2A family protein phosphatase
MCDADAHIMCFGHTHKPYHRIIEDKGHFRHAINVGSVGKPKDGNPDACYVLLTINSNTRTITRDSIIASFIRVAYDKEKAARAIEGSILPSAYADMLRNGA